MGLLAQIFNVIIGILSRRLQNPQTFSFELCLKPTAIEGSSKTDNLDIFHSYKWIKFWGKGIYDFQNITYNVVEAETWDRV